VLTNGDYDNIIRIDVIEELISHSKIADFDRENEPFLFGIEKEGVSNDKELLEPIHEAPSLWEGYSQG